MRFNIRIRRGTSSEWANKNPVLGSGEPGLETDTGRFKIGTGINSWSSLPYYITEEQILEQIETAVEAFFEANGDTGSKIGNLADLTTNEKETIVGAINEVNTPSPILVSLYTDAKE